MVHTFEVRTQQRTEFVEISAQVSAIVRRAGVQTGLCHVYVPHTTAGVTIQEHADPDVVGDILAVLARLVPHNGRYRHAEGNSDAHVMAALMGTETSVPIIDGRLAFGTWQGIFLCEFDGPRTRRVIVTVIERAADESSRSVSLK